MHKRPLFILGYAAVVILMANLNAIVDAVLHPQIPYFDEEHLIVGITGGLTTAVLFSLLFFQLDRQQRIIGEKTKAEKKLKASLLEKETLLKEVHHRVKNNMQVVASLLNLQSRYTKDDMATAALAESQNRIKAMALVHETLYRAGDLRCIDFQKYIKQLVQNLFHFYGVNRERIGLHIDAADITLEVNAAIPCGLVLNELISNALKYAFVDGRSGEIRVRLAPAEEGRFALVVHDSGIGLPDHLNEKKAESLGLSLVHMLVEDQLGGEISCHRDNGTEFRITLPLEGGA